MRSPDPARRRRGAVGLVALVGLLATVAGAVSPTTATAAEPWRPPEGSLWFGPALDWQDDSPADYAARLGAPPSLLGVSIGYPLTPTSELVLHDVSAQSAGAGAVAVVTVEPADIAAVGPADAAQLSAVVAEVTEQDGSRLLLRFAPEMNGSWAPWSRRPLTYVATFRALADAVHGATDAALMLWSPAYAGGYPSPTPLEATTRLQVGAPEFDRRNIPYLDTDGDGAITTGDDPYGPYYPGDEYVDWVGLTMLRAGQLAESGANTRPARSELEERFDSGGKTSFYARFAAGPAQPFLLTTAALFAPGRPGADEAGVQRAWLGQVLAAASSRPLVAAVQWSEGSRLEPGRGDLLRGQLTDDPALASLSRAVLERGQVSFAPVAGVGAEARAGADSAVVVGSEPGAAPPTSDASPEGAGFPPFLGGVLVTLAAVLVGAVVAVRVRRRRAVPSWLR